jgi:hypothetical protein
MASIFRVEGSAKQETSMQALQSLPLFEKSGMVTF